MNLGLMGCRNNLPGIKDGAYAINLDDKQSKRTQWISSIIERNTVVYFHSIGIEHNPQEVLSKIKGKSITHNIFRTHDDDSIMCGFYCIAFIE